MPGNDEANTLLDSALFFIDKPGEEKNDLDSASRLVRKAEKINKGGQRNQFIEGKMYFAYAILARLSQNPDSGKLYIQKSIRLLKDLEEPEQLGKTYGEESQYYSIYDKQQLEKKIECCENALQQYRLASLKEKQADALRELGDLNQFQRNFGKALLQLNEALGLYHAVGAKDLQGLYDLLCSVSTDMGDPAAGVRYGLLAVKTAENVHDTTTQLCTIYNRLAVAYSAWSRKGEAVTYLKKALAIAQKYHDADAIETVLLNICFLPHNEKDYRDVVSLVRLSDKSVQPQALDDSVYFYACYNLAYIAGKKYDAASFYANELRNMISRYPWDNMMLAPVYSGLATYYLAKKDYLSAEKYASTYIDFCRKNRYRNSLAIAYFFRSKADSGLGNFQSALSDFKQYKTLVDSIMDDSKSSQIAQLQVVNETEKKNNDLKLKQQNIAFLTNKNQLQEVNINKEKNTRNIVIISSLLLLAMAYTGYQVKQRHNRKLQVQQLEINKQNQQLKKLIEEKEWLVKEIHHRVKNNLQIVMSLMNIQSSYLESGEALDAIKETQSRMNAMSLIHQKLYQSASLVSINMHKYVGELINYLMESFNKNKKIKAIIDIANVDLDVSQAVPIGLILNEAVTNSIKYAFTDVAGGTIKVSLQPVEEDEWLLVIADNGKGLPRDLDYKKKNSVGIVLIETLAEQIGGFLHFNNDGGLTICIKFVKTEPAGIPLLSEITN